MVPAFGVGALTTITGVVTNADGSRASGSMFITPNSVWTADDGHVVAKVTRIRRLVAGVITGVGLYPNDNSVPASTSYTVRYALDNAAPYSETWIVPSGGPVDVSVVRTLTPPTPVATLNISQLVPVGANHTFLGSNGTSLSFTAPFSLTTSGSSGASTFIAGVLNIPQYTGGGGGTVGGANCTVAYSSSFAIDLSLTSGGVQCTIFTVTLAGNPTVTLINPSLARSAASIVWVQSGSGTFTASLPGTALGWCSTNTVPTGKSTIQNFHWDGTNYNGDGCIDINGPGTGVQYSYCRGTGTVGGGGDVAYTCSPDPPLSVYVTGKTCVVLNGDISSTTTASVNLSGVGVVSLLARDGNPLAANAIVGNQPLTTCYNGIAFIIQGGSTTSTTTYEEPVLFMAANGLQIGTTAGGTKFYPIASVTGTTVDARGWNAGGQTGSGMGVISLGASSTPAVYFLYTLPDDWTSTIRLKILSTIEGFNNTGTVAIHHISTSCMTPGATSLTDLTALTYNASQDITITLATGSARNLGSFNTIATLTTTGCAAGQLLVIQDKRTGGSGGDNALDQLDVAFVQLKVYHTN